MKILILCVLIGILSGCGGYRMSEITGQIDGNNLNTPAGKANGKLNYKSVTCVGFFGGRCPDGISK